MSPVRGFADKTGIKMRQYKFVLVDRSEACHLPEFSV